MLAAVLLVLVGDRVEAARQQAGESLRARVRTAGLRYPVKHVLFRGFKVEKDLEVWGSNTDGVFRKIATFPIAAASGEVGPKRREGDLQVPEGFYRIDAFNPKSRFLLSMRVSYPNASDRIRGQRPLGGDIFIHGSRVSIGCLAMTNPVIQELYLLSFDASGSRSVHLFPTRMEGPRYRSLVRSHPRLRPFWSELKKGYDAFEETRRLPTVRVHRDGRYLVEVR